MAGLRRLDLTENPFTGEAILELSLAVEENTTIQSIECDPDLPNYRKMVRYLDLNWGGRRYLDQKKCESPLPSALWALVLGRTTKKLAGADCGKERQADILYVLLRLGPALFPV